MGHCHCCIASDGDASTHREDCEAKHECERECVAPVRMRSLQHASAASADRTMSQPALAMDTVRTPSRAFAQPMHATAANIDKMVLWTTPALDSVSHQTTLRRANSDPTLSPRRTVCNDNERAADKQQDGADRIKRRRSSGFASFGKRAALDEKLQDGFLDVFGLLGIPTVLSFVFAGSAVLVQAFIQVYPTQFANALMKTTNFDGGDFWLIPETDVAPKVIATTLLVLCAACYFVLALVMLFFRHNVVGLFKKTPKTKQMSPTRLDVVLPATDESTGTPKKRDLSSVKHHVAVQSKRTRYALGSVYAKFAHIDGPYHAYYVRYVTRYASGASKYRLICAVIRAGVALERGL